VSAKWVLQLHLFFFEAADCHIQTGPGNFNEGTKLKNVLQHSVDHCSNLWCAWQVVVSCVVTLKGSMSHFHDSIQLISVHSKSYRIKLQLFTKVNDICKLNLTLSYRVVTLR